MRDTVGLPGVTTEHASDLAVRQTIMNQSTPPPIVPRDNAEFVAHWKRVGPLLEEIRTREQEQTSDENRRLAIDRVLDLSYRFRTERSSTGLIELQKFYRKAFQR